MSNGVTIPKGLQAEEQPLMKQSMIPAGQPPQEVIDAIEGGYSDVTRRVEFYESDRDTRWMPSGLELDEDRLVSGNVSIDYTRDERRALDLVVSNSDNRLRPDPNGGLWYDKAIKVFRGVKYAGTFSLPRICIVEAETIEDAYAFKQILGSIGYTRVDVDLDAETFDEVHEYDFLVSYMKYDPTDKADLLKSAYRVGRKIFTLGAGNTSAEIPMISAHTSASSREYGIDPVSGDTPLDGGWVEEVYGTHTGRAVTAVQGSAIVVATWFDSVTNYVAAIDRNVQGGRWFNFESGEYGTEALTLWKNALGWLQDYRPYKTWEYQLGVFGIDNIASEQAPSTVSITGRDFTANIIRSCFEENLSFDAGVNLTYFVTAIAANAGVTKFHVAQVDDVLPTKISFEKGTSRWECLKTVTSSLNYELFMGPDDYLVMRPFIDPTTGPITWTFRTGRSGNLASFGRSINDSRIFNHICVYGENDDGLPYFGEAINTEPSSPTNVARIGDRFFMFEGGIFDSDEACTRFARRLLKTAALESFEISWSSYVYPWLEAGEIIEFFDPERLTIEPTRFLMDTINVSLGLEPQPATGKRVTFVDDLALKQEEGAIGEITILPGMRGFS